MAARWGLRHSIVVAAAAVLLGGCGGGSGGGPVMETVRIGDETFHLEVAADPAATARGLMERESIPPDGGMLFVFPEVRTRWFWMKNCVVDIDLIFLDGRGTVTATHRMTIEPPRRESEGEFDYETRLQRYPSRYPAQFAIELEAGSIDRLGVKVEDQIELDLSRLKAMVR
jgi:uncharacterized membrane protein (UPF0127 family)